jgi:hypothetical protein
MFDLGMAKHCGQGDKINPGFGRSRRPCVTKIVQAEPSNLAFLYSASWALLISERADLDRQHAGTGKDVAGLYHFQQRVNRTRLVHACTK